MMKLVLITLALACMLISCQQRPPIELTEPCRPVFYLLPPLTDYAGNPILAIALVARSELEGFLEAKAILAEALATGSVLWSEIQEHHRAQNPAIKKRVIEKMNSLLGADFVLDFLTTGDEPESPAEKLAEPPSSTGN